MEYIRFTRHDYRAGVFILVTGKCENKLNRLSLIIVVR